MKEGTPGWCSWLSFRFLILANVIISGWWDPAPHWALCWVWSLLRVSLSPFALPNRFFPALFFKERKKEETRKEEKRRKKQKEKIKLGERDETVKTIRGCIDFKDKGTNRLFQKLRPTMLNVLCRVLTKGN